MSLRRRASPFASHDQALIRPAPTGMSMLGLTLFTCAGASEAPLLVYLTPDCAADSPNASGRATVCIHPPPREGPSASGLVGHLLSLRRLHTEYNSQTHLSCRVIITRLESLRSTPLADKTCAREVGDLTSPVVRPGHRMVLRIVLVGSQTLSASRVCVCGLMKWESWLS